MAKNCIYNIIDENGDLQTYYTEYDMLKAMGREPDLKGRDEYTRQLRNEWEERIQQKLNESKKDIENSANSLTKPLENIKRLFNSIKQSVPNINEILTDNVAIEQAIIAINRTSNAELEGKISQVKLVLIILQEYKIIGFELEKYVKQIIADEKLSIDEKYSIVSDVKNYFNSMYLLSSSLEKEFHEFLDSSEPVFADFKAIESIDDSIRFKAKNLTLEYFGQDTMSYFDTSVLSDTESNPWVELSNVYKKRAEEALKQGNVKRAREMEDKSKEILDNRPSLEVMKKLLQGEGKDMNKLSFLFESMIKSSDFVVSALRKKVEHMRYKAQSRWFSTIKEPLSKEFNDYKQASGKSKFNSKELNEALTEQVTVYKYNYQTKEIDQSIVIEYKKNFDRSALSKAQAEWVKQIDITTDRDEKRKLRKAYKAWQIENFQQEFTEQIYAPEDLLTDEASDALREINDEIYRLQRELFTNYSDEVNKALLIAEVDKKRLAFEHDHLGRPKSEKDIIIARSIKAFYEARKDLFKDPTSETATRAFKEYRLQLEAFKESLNKRLDRVGDTQKERDINEKLLKRWKLQNEKVTIDQAFFDKRTAIYERINFLQKEVLNIDKERTGTETEIWEKIYQVTGPYRNTDRLIYAENMTNKEREYVKRLLEQLEQIKRNSITKYGFSKTENLKLNTLIKNYKLIPYTKVKGNEYVKYLSGLKYQMENVVDRSDSFEEDLSFITDYAERYQEAKIKLGKEKAELSEEMLENIEAAEKEIKGLYLEINRLQESVNTPNYEAMFDKEFESYFGLYRHIVEGIPENQKRQYLLARFQDVSPSNLYKSQWYIDNHMEVLRYDEKDGGFTTVWQPLYMWTEILPKDERYMYVEPATKYYKKEYKDIYKNNEFEKDPFFNQGKLRSASAFVTSKEFNVASHEKKALDFLISMSAELQKDIEHDFLKLGYAIPVMRKSVTDRIIEGDVSAENMWKSLKRQFSSTEFNTDEGIGIEHEDKEHLFSIVPLQFNSNAEIENISYDVWGAMEKFGYSTIMRKELVDNFGKVKDLLELVSGKDGTLNLQDSNVKGKNVFNTVKNLRQKGSTRAKAIEEMIRSIWFNETSYDEGIKGWDAQQTVRTMNKATALTTLVWNIPSAITNLLSARTQVLIESLGGDLITFKDYQEANIEYFKKMQHYMTDSLEQDLAKHSIHSKMLTLWGAVQGRFDESIGKGYGDDRTKQFINSGFGGNYLRNATEFQAQVQLWLAALKSRSIKVNGETMNLLRFYEMIAEKEKVYSIADLKTTYKLENGDGSEFTIKDENSLKLKIQRINSELNGEYEKMNKSVMEKSSLGSALFFFRRYFVSIVTNRWAGASDKRYDNGTNRLTEGFYITAWNVLLKPLVYLRFKELKTNVLDAMTEKRLLTKEEARNLRRFYIETTVITALYVLIGAIGDDPDELKDHSFLTLYMLYFMKKVKSETEQVHPIGGFNELRNIVRTPSIAFNQLANYSRLWDNIGYTLTGDDKAYLASDAGFWKEGDSKVFKDILAVGTGFKGNTFYPEQLIKGFEYGQRNR